MAIRDVSGLPDDHPMVPAWVRERRALGRAERKKLCQCGLHFGARDELLAHTDDTGHIPLVPNADDPFIVRWRPHCRWPRRGGPPA
jgi:hypothetical protein